MPRHVSDSRLPAFVWMTWDLLLAIWQVLKLVGKFFWLEVMDRTTWLTYTIGTTIYFFGWGVPAFYLLYARNINLLHWYTDLLVFWLVIFLMNRSGRVTIERWRFRRKYQRQERSSDAIEVKGTWES